MDIATIKITSARGGKCRRRKADIPKEAQLLSLYVFRKKAADTTAIILLKQRR